MQRLYAQRATGSLLLLHGATKKIVLFVDGYPVSVRSNLLGECLGQILLEKRLITSEVLAESVGRMQKEKRHQGEILVEMGALSPYNLTARWSSSPRPSCSRSSRGATASSCSSRATPRPGRPLRLERSPAALMLEGIRRHYDSARQDAALESTRATTSR